MPFAKPFALALLVLLVGLVGCASSDKSDTDAENEVSNVSVNDVPRSFCPYLMLLPCPMLMRRLRGQAAALMSHQWEVKGAVVELDKKAGIAIVSVDSDDDYLQYLNNPIAVSVEGESGVAVGERVLVTFLPPSSEETIVHPSDLAVLSEGQ